MDEVEEIIGQRTVKRLSDVVLMIIPQCTDAHISSYFRCAIIYSK